MPIVVIERGNDKGKSIKLEEGRKYLFGRDPAASITFDDSLTSRRHFEIVSTGGTFEIRDVGSTNGTFLNDERLPDGRKPLDVGDKIQAGETILSFLSDQREETAQGLVGKTIGGYKLLERVGRGGMGTVYKANQLSLNRIVAFKVLSARLLKDEKFIERFKSEARAAGQLNHPNIVQVYDVGTDRQIHFFSMEFMDGASVQDLIGKDEKLTWEEALDVLIQSARALIYAEKKGIVHRDVKPDNLMLTSDGQTKLADLGLAKKLDGSEATPEEGIFGTPHFISPEQARGQEVDHRADLYSLGATAYRLLSGRTPFKGANVSEIIQKQISEEPPPLRQFCPEAPEELVEIVQKLMQKSPDERYPSAEDLLADLEQVRLKYHLKLQGAGGGKGVYAAIGVALLAVIAVVVFALTRGNGQNGNGNGNHAGPIVPSVTTRPETGTADRQPSPEEIQAQREKDAELAHARVTVQEARLGLGRLEETALEKKDAWLNVAKLWDEVASDNEGTRFGTKAKDRAEAIRKQIELAENAKAEEKKNAEAAWRNLKKQVNDCLADEKFAEALRIAEAADKRPDMKKVLQLAAGAREELETWLSDASGSIKARFSAAWAEVKDEVAKLHEQHRFAEAADRTKEFLDQAVGAEKRSPFGPALEERAALVAEMKAELEALLDERLAADRTLYYRTWRAVRHYDEHSGDYPDNPVFDFRFDQAAARFRALLGEGEGGFVTDLYRSRAESTAARLESADAFLLRIIQAFNDDELLNRDLLLPDDLAGGSNVSLTLRTSDPPMATRQGLDVTKKFNLAGTTAVSDEVLPWDRFAAGELWRCIVLEGRRFEMTPEDHANAAIFLTICGVAEPVNAELSAAGTTLSPEDLEWLRQEMEAMQYHMDLRRAEEERRPPNEREIFANKFVQKYHSTDFFILVYDFPDPWQRLFPQKALAGWKAAKLEKVK